MLSNAMTTGAKITDSLRNANTPVTLEKAKTTLKSYFNKPGNAEIQTIASKWKEIKKKADISTHESYNELITFLNSVHEKAENELDAKKNTWLQWGKSLIKTVDCKGTLTQYTSVFDQLKIELKSFHETVIDTRLEALVRATNKPISTAAERLQFLSGLSLQLKLIQNDIKTYLGSKYQQTLGSSGGKNEQSITEEFPYCAVYLRIMMSLAGIGSQDSSDQIPTTKTGIAADKPAVPKEYIKYFGKGFLAKATYNAVIPLLYMQNETE